MAEIDAEASGFEAEPLSVRAGWVGVGDGFGGHGSEKDELFC